MTFPPQFREILRSRKGWRWVIVDFLIAFISIWSGLKLFQFDYSFEPYQRLLISTGYGMLLVISIRLCGLNTHRVEHLFTRYEILLASLQGSIIALFIVDGTVRILSSDSFGRYSVGLTLVFSILGVFLTRVSYQLYLKNNPINVAFMCRNALIEDLSKRFKSDPHFNVVCVGSEEPLQQSDDEVKFKNIVINDPDDFVKILKENKTDFAISVYDGKMSPVISHVIKRLPFAGIDVLNLGAFIELFHREIPLSYRNLHWHTADFFLPKHSATVLIKRLIDFIAALVGLILLLPVFPIIMLLVKLDSPGPAFYSQLRIGLKGKPFNIHKFRTMRQDAESSGAQWAKKNDPRITRIGAFLRKTRLDEIPQLWNVVKGDMSLVGPRPERPEFTEDLKEKIPLYEWRSLVPPGLTGWAQIRHGYTDTAEGIQRKLQYDLFYIKNHSIWLDLEIMLRTIPMIMKGSR